MGMSHLEAEHDDLRRRMGCTLTRGGPEIILTVSLIQFRRSYGISKANLGVPEGRRFQEGLSEGVHTLNVDGTMPQVSCRDKGKPPPLYPPLPARVR